MDYFIRFHAKIQGRVQGVYYRAWTQQTAESLGLSGWVRNLSDGRVELLAEGERAQLEELHRRCLQGPPAASVKKIEVEWLAATGEFESFKVLR